MWYKFPSQYCFCCVPKFLIRCNFVVMEFKAILMSLKNSSLKLWLFRSVFFICQLFVWHLFSCHISVNYFCIHGMISVMLNLFRFVLWSRLWTFLENVPWVLEKICILMSSDGVFYIFQLEICFYLFLNVFHFCLLADFLSSSSIDCWEIREELSNYVNGFLYFSFHH